MTPLERVGRDDPRYPAALLELIDPPDVLYVAGAADRLQALSDGGAVAVVGTRKPSPYGLEMARTLSCGLASAGVPVISGLAIGIDSAAHAATLDRGGVTVAVVPGGAERAHPASRGRLYRRIIIDGLVLSEQPPGRTARRWSFAARNRIIAALAGATVVVEAGERSGALQTAAIARELARPLGAVPGRVGTRMAAGPNALLAAGAAAIRGAQDVLDLLYGVGVRTAPAHMREPIDPELDPVLDPALEQLLTAIEDGHESAAALARAGIAADQGLAALARLELSGYVTRGPGGRFTVIR